MAVRELLPFLLAVAYGSHESLPVFSCVQHTHCDVDISSLNVTSQDAVVFDDSEEGACPRCLWTDLGVCPFSRMTSGVPGAVFCEDGSYSFRWSCREEGKGERLLCPPNHTMCAGRLCGGGKDHCCVAQNPQGIADCNMHEGWRRCPFQSLENLQIQRNYTMGPHKPGKHLFCKCTVDDFGRNATATPLGVLELKGPNPWQVTTCSSGAPYCEFFHRDSYGVLPQTTALQVTPLFCDALHQTPENFKAYFRTGWQPELGGVYFTNRSDLAARDPGIYTLCWCENSTAGACESLEDYNLSAGTLVLTGPVRERREIRAEFDEEFTVSVHMVLVAGQSQLRIQSSCGEDAVIYANATSTEIGPLGSVSDDRNFSFGTLEEGLLQSGRYKLCWCQVSYSVSPQVLCEDRDFITEVGEVTVLCQKHFYTSGTTCKPCTWFWEVPNDARNGCRVNVVNTIVILSIFLYMFFGCVMFCYQLEVHISQRGFKFPLRGRKIAIEDVCSKPSPVEAGDKHLIITTVGEHRLSKRLGTIPIMLRKTDLFGMEKTATGDSIWYRLKYHSKRSFQLLDIDGVPVQREGAETSHGVIILSAPRALLHSNTFLGLPVVSIGSFLVLCGIPLLLHASEMLRIPIEASVVTVTSLITVACAFGTSQLMKMSQTARPSISERIDRFLGKVKLTNPTPRACERGPDRALNIHQIVDLYEEFKPFIQDRNLYYVDSNIVRPLTESCHLSLAELLGPSKVDWFVSHYWGTCFHYTVRALRLHAAAMTSPEDAKDAGASGELWTRRPAIAYWICAFSNNQYRIAEELGATHEESSFYKALHSSSVVGTAMILDEQALPLTRSWCLFELLQTMNLERCRSNFQGLRFCTNTGVLNLGQSTTEVAMNIGKKLSTLSLENANATNEKDGKQIRDLIIKERGSWQGINSELRKHIKDALGVCREHVDENFQAIFKELERGTNRAESMRETSL